MGRRLSTNRFNRSTNLPSCSMTFSRAAVSFITSFFLIVYTTSQSIDPWPKSLSLFVQTTLLKPIFHRPIRDETLLGDNWRPLISCCRCAHLEQSSAVCNCISISTDFSEEIENWAVSKIVHDCQSSVTHYFVTWPWSFFYLCHFNGNSCTN